MHHHMCIQCVPSDRFATKEANGGVTQGPWGGGGREERGEACWREQGSGERGKGGHEVVKRAGGGNNKGHTSILLGKTIALVHSESLDLPFCDNDTDAIRTCTPTHYPQLQVATAVLLGLEQWAPGWCFPPG